MSYKYIATLINTKHFMTGLAIVGISVLCAKFYDKVFISAPFNACEECTKYFLEKEGCTQKTFLCENCETPIESVKRIYF